MPLIGVPLMLSGRGRGLGGTWRHLEALTGTHYSGGEGRFFPRQSYYCGTVRRAEIFHSRVDILHILHILLHFSLPHHRQQASPLLSLGCNIHQALQTQVFKEISLHFRFHGSDSSCHHWLFLGKLLLHGFEPGVDSVSQGRTWRQPSPCGRHRYGRSSDEWCVKSTH